MQFIALATDLDGTLIRHSMVDPATVAALERLKATGRRLILVTGRELPEIKAVFPRVKLFDRVVAENGALLYTPASEQERLLAPPPPPDFVRHLQEHGVEPLSVGRAIVATWEPNETVVLQAIHELGLEQQIIFNKGAVMILAPGVNKASGLAEALEDLELSAHNVAAIGDAENDHSFLQACGVGVAVANALPMLKRDADLVTDGNAGAGVVELVDRLIRDDLASVTAIAERHRIPIGRELDGAPVHLSAWGESILISGMSGGGKSTLATALLERLVEHDYQFCVLDPEGDYNELEEAVIVGDPNQVPRAFEVLGLMRRPSTNVAVNLLALDPGDRPAYFADFLPKLGSLRARTGRPHWILVDEAHHMLPAARGTVPLTLPSELPATILVTVHPKAVAKDALARVDTVLAIGGSAPDAVRAFFQARGEEAPALPGVPQGKGEALLWNRTDGARIVCLDAPRQARRRHTRKYAQGELGPDRSFWFRGPRGAMKLRAQNLLIFCQMAEGLDDETWLHHLHAGDYSAWFRDAIKDDDLAAEVAAVEENRALDVVESRQQICAAIERRYTAPASTGT